jgi:Flp pilus assembly protein TadG
MIRPATTRSCFARAGAHTVEFAVVAPVFFLLILAFVEFGRGMMTSSMISNSARIGCRTGVLPGKANSDVTGAIDSFLQGQGINGYTTTIQVNGSTVDVSTAQSGDTINVQVTIPVANTSWLPGLSFLSGNFAGDFTMPHE